VNHKYGFHANRTGNDVLDAIRRLRPRTIKALDHDVDFWKEVRTLLPDVFLIGRVTVPQSVQARFANDPAGTGRSFAEAILRLEANRTSVQGRLLFDAWESYNEVLPGSAAPDLKRAYDDFQVAFARPIKQAGLEPVAMNFGTGNMLGEDFLGFFPGTMATYTSLGFHEYDWPDMWRLHKENIEEKDEGGMWLTLRYRRIMTQVRKVYGNRHKVLITECGMTQGVLGGADVGWRHPPTVPAHVLQYLKERNIDPNVTEERYWNSLLWYNGELMKDDYVSAALLYVVGAVHPWESFEHLGGILNRLEAFQESEPDGPPAEGSLEEKLLAAAAEAQVIQFNPKAALQKRLFADGFVPNSPEFEVEHERVTYVAQRAEHLGTGEVRVYYVPKGDWAQVAYIRRGKGEEIILT
jgi:hypothetical protein